MESLRIERLPPYVVEAVGKPANHRYSKPHRAMGSLECSKFLLQEAKVAGSPGIGFGGADASVANG